MADLELLLAKVMDRTATIVFLAPALKERGLLVKSFLDAGFLKVKTYRNAVVYLKDQELEKDHFLFLELEVSAIDRAEMVLRSIYDSEDQSVLPRVALLVDKNALAYIPKFFSLGALLWVPALPPASELSRAHEIVTDFLARVEMFKAKPEAEMAAFFLRNYLKKYFVYDDLLTLEKSLLKLFPEKLDYTIRVVEALFLTGDFKSGRELMDQARQYSIESLDKHIDALQAKYPGALLQKGGSLADKLGFSKVYLKEGDETERKILRGVLGKIGIQDPIELGSFSELLSKTKADKPDLIICDWAKRGSDLSGSQFVQRLRGIGLTEIPIIIAVGKMTEPEAQLLADMHISQIITKPMREEHALMATAYSLQQIRTPTERKSIEEKIVQSLEKGDLTFAKFLKKKHFSSKDVLLSRKCYIEGMIYFYEKEYLKAKAVLLKAVKAAKEEEEQLGSIKPNIGKLILLSKVLFKLNEGELAIKLLENAKRKSPQNLTIHLSLLEIRASLGDFKVALTHLEDAKALDASSELVINAGLKLKLLNNDIKGTKELLADKSVNKREFITKTNNEAVLKIREGRFDQALILYQNALKSLNDSEGELKSVLLYNLSLAFLRRKEIENGKEALEKAITYTESKVHKRALSLHHRLENAIATGSELILKAPQAARFEARDLLSSASHDHQKPTATVALLGIFESATLKI